MPARFLSLLPPVAVALAAWLAPPASAQVIRCTDAATGKVTYTDGDCRGGEAAREVQPRKSPQDIEQEREQAAEALERKYERQQHEDRLRRQAERPAPAQRAAPSDPAHSAQCQRERKNLQDVLATLGRGMYDEQARLDAAQRQADLACLRPADFARAERERASRPAYSPPYYGPPVVVVPPRPGPPPPRREITHCNVFRCYDRQGNTYPR